MLRRQDESLRRQDESLSEWRGTQDKQQQEWRGTQDKQQQEWRDTQEKRLQIDQQKADFNSALFRITALAVLSAVFLAGLAFAFPGEKWLRFLPVLAPFMAVAANLLLR